MTEWKPIKGSDDYLISNTGVVKRIRNYRRDGIIKIGKGGRVQLNRKNTTIGKLMRDHWRFEWIKDLEDDEMVKPVPGHPDHFITNKGRVFSLYFYDWIKPHREIGHPYYQRISIHNKLHRLHTMLGRLFLPDYEPGLEICHTDEELPIDKVNQLDNLWVGTHRDNHLDKERKGRVRHTRGEDHPRWNPSLH